MTVITRQDLNRARRGAYGETVTYQRNGEVIVPPSVEPAPFPQSLPNGAEKVYREDRATDSIQIRVYEDHVTLQLDQHNPKYSPAKHAVYDATEYTVATLLAASVLLGSG